MSECQRFSWEFVACLVSPRSFSAVKCGLQRGSLLGSLLLSSRATYPIGSNKCFFDHELSGGAGEGALYRCDLRGVRVVSHQTVERLLGVHCHALKMKRLG
jgi:hypothetical protein